ncbi:hypothetical protein HDU97_009026 [Phlyctochytrium planicorne]|nr:hypothetical protein HDU97_009026 [Phlyctochytrium planicorne]
MINRIPNPGQFSAAPVIHSAPIISTPAMPIPQATVFIPSPMDKLTTVFVGSITEGVYDTWVERILRSCGNVRNWKRVTDANGKPKGFGFCIFDSAESVLRALRILGGEGSEAGPVELPSLDANFPSKKLLLKVDAVARRHIDDYKANMSRNVSPEAVAQGDTMAREELGVVLKEMKSVSAESFLSSIIPAGAEKPPSGNPLDDLPAEMPPEEREKVSKEISLFRERAAASDREKREREEKMEERRREAEREKNREKERERDFDRNNHDHARVHNRSQQMEEIDEEEEKRRQEKREREVAQAYAEREARYFQRESQRLRALRNHQSKQAEMEAKRIRDREGMKRRLEEWDDDVERDRGNELFYFDRVRWRHQRESFLQREIDMDNKDRAAEQEELARRVPDVEEERRRKEEEKAREREEERLQRERETKAAASSGFMVTRIMTVEERKQAIENLVKSIPADKENLIAFPIKWKYIDQTLVDSKLRPFISKKVTEVLGEEDKDLTEFIAGSVRKHISADKLIDELIQALDEEAEILVLKLYRMVIYESEARANGLS